MIGDTMTSEGLRIRKMLLLWYFITCLVVLSGVAAETCYSPVNLELGKTSTLLCSFPEGFHTLQWYDDDDIFGKTAIVTYNELREKHGPGYSSGKFDIDPNGSLIIRNVSIEHETTFTVTVFRTLQQLPQHYQIHVETVAKPLQNRPVVPACDNTLGPCYIEWTQSSNVSCRIEHSRPAINITWSLRNSSDNIVLSRHQSWSDYLTHTTDEMLQDPAMYHTNLSLYACKADDPIGLLEKKETTVLLEKKDIDWSQIPVNEVVVERFSNVNLLCTQRSPRIVVWKKGESVKDLVTTVYDVPSEDNFTSSMPDRWELGVNSLLTIHEVQIADESTYACHSYDSKMESFDVYKLKVIVPPSPVYPFIEGCPSDRYCVLEKKSNDTITCAVRGIRPRVDLKLQSFPPDSPTVPIIDPHCTVMVGIDLIDVSLTAKLGFRGMTSTRHTLECIMTGENASMFTTLSTKFDVILTDRMQPTKTPLVSIQTGIQSLWIPLIVMAVVIVCLISITRFLSTVIQRRRHIRHKKQRTLTDTKKDTPPKSVDSDILIELRGDVEKIKKILLSPTKPRHVNSSAIEMMKRAPNNVCLDLSLTDSGITSDEETDEMRLPILPALRSLSINKPGHIFSENHVTGILKYAQTCQGVKAITFSNCILPFWIEDETAASIIREGKLQVSWNTTSGVSYYIDAKSGKWKNKDSGDELEESYYIKEVKEFQEMYPNMV